MLTCMRSTVIIDDELFRKAKQRAAALNTTLSAIVNQALREALSRPVAKAAPFQMITFGNPKARLHREPAEHFALVEREDRETLRR